ncbi:DUF1080 domain-containing protein [Ravibacter arvi]
MKTRLYSLSAALLLMFAVSFQAEAQKKKKIELFNGKNLDGWYTFLRTTGKNSDPKGVFTVSKGLIAITGEEYGCITTNEEYENYKLVVEFKWGEKTFAPRVDRARDNGVLIHSQGKDGGYGNVWMNSIECQIIEGGTGDFLVVGDGSENFAISCPVAPEKQNGSYIYQPGGQLATIHKGRVNWLYRDPEWKDVIDFRGAKDVEKAVGKWNRMEVIAKGDNIDLYLNGVLVNQAVKVKPSKGRIQIQSEGAEMYVRKVELTPL